MRMFSLILLLCRCCCFYYFFRPSHWGKGAAKAPKAPTPKFNASLTSNNGSFSTMSYQDRQRKQLAAASATSSFLMLPPQSRHRGGSASPRRSNGGHDHQKDASMYVSPTSATTAAVGTGESPSTIANASEVSFMPDFLTTIVGQTTDDALDDISTGGDPMDFDDNTGSMMVGDGGDCGNAANPRGTAGNISFLDTVRAAANPPRTNRFNQPPQDEKLENGNGLSQLLRDVRSEMRINGTRLRSGEYPFPNKVTSRFDLCDPRNRATSYMDVTLLAEWKASSRKSPVTASRGRSQQSANNNATVFGYIHEHNIFPSRNVLASKQASLTASPDNTHRGVFAWFCISEDTMQEHNLQQNDPQGYQLRIYNAITISVPPTGATRSPDNETNQSLRQHTVLCTQFCEPYPTHVLGPLQPHLSALIAQLQGST